MTEIDTGTAWHALEVDQVLDRLEVEPKKGLAAREAADRLERFGPNELARDEPPGALEVLLRQFRSPLIYILLVAAVVTVALGEYVDTGVIHEVSIEEARTVALTTMVIFMAFHVGNSRSERHSLFSLNPMGNPFLLAATAGALTLHALALHWSFTQFVLRVTPLDGATWLRMAAIASSVILVSELHKLLRSEKRGRAGQTATTPRRAPARRERQRSEPPG